MPKAYPIDVGVEIKSVASDVLKIDWGVNHFIADFTIPQEDGVALQVCFEGATIVRLLDEMPLSTEEDACKTEGYVPYHFAYRIEGSSFERTQSSAWKEVMGPVSHYQFVTGFACVDVLCSRAPFFKTVLTGS